MALAFLLTVLFALSQLISCQEYGAKNLVSNVYRSAHPVKTGYGAPNPPSFTFEGLFFLQNRFWKNFLSPANAKQADPLSYNQTSVSNQRPQAKAINSTLLASDVRGRIDITRSFQGRELNTEYIFGLFANLAASPNSISLLGVPVSYEITHFAANQNIASASTRLIFNTTSFNLPVPITIDTWITFNSANEISQYDAIFKWWPWAIEYILGKAAIKLQTKTLAETVEKLTVLLAESICSTAQGFCKDANAQYANVGECKEFLTQKIRFGQAHEA
ncbi:hypothetical protein MMC29_002334, partial [Sticta canariensis]|nr:hypothetical protein [Sticta canariensis]